MAYPARGEASPAGFFSSTPGKGPLLSGTGARRPSLPASPVPADTHPTIKLTITFVVAKTLVSVFHALQNDLSMFRGSEGLPDASNKRLQASWPGASLPLCLRLQEGTSPARDCSPSISSIPLFAVTQEESKEAGRAIVFLEPELKEKTQVPGQTEIEQSNFGFPPSE
jgi:hypothetical protein